MSTVETAPSPTLPAPSLSIEGRILAKLDALAVDLLDRIGPKTRYDLATGEEAQAGLFLLAYLAQRDIKPAKPVLPCWAVAGARCKHEGESFRVQGLGVEPVQALVEHEATKRKVLFTPEHLALCTPVDEEGNALAPPFFLHPVEASRP